MALSQRLQIRQSQALVMTPQLMQAIKLLQLSNLDLTAYVEAELERNPLLDRGNEPGSTGETDGPAASDESGTTGETYNGSEAGEESSSSAGSETPGGSGSEPSGEIELDGHVH